MVRLVHSAIKRLYRLGGQRPRVVKRRGALFLLDPKNWIDNRLLAGAPFENEQLTRARDLVETHSITHVLDIGANIGLYTVLLGLIPGVERVDAFEPVARNHAQLLSNVFLNDLTGKVTVHRTALAAQPGQATIHIDPRSTGVSRLSLDGISRDPTTFSETETVPVARLDDVVTGSGRRVFAKIDVEGKAAEVLAGMSSFLASNDVVLQIELTTEEQASAEPILRRAGYKPVGVIEGDHYFRR